MPTVPVYQQQVRATVQPAYRQRLDARGTFGPDTEQFARDVDRATMLYDEYQAKKAYTQYSSALTDLVENPDTGLINAQGEAVFNVGQTFKQKSDELRKQYLGGLSNRAAARANMFMDNAASGYQTTLNRHIRTETEKLFDAQDNAALSIAQGNAVRFVGQPEGDTALGEIGASLDSFAARKGIGKGTDPFIALEHKAYGEVAKGVVGRYLDAGDVNSANLYLEKLGGAGKVNGADIAELQTKINGKADVLTVQSVADEIKAKGMGYSQAMSFIEGKYSGELETKIKAEVKTRFAENEYAQNKYEQDRTDWGIDQMYRLKDDPAGRQKLIESEPSAKVRNDMRRIDEHIRTGGADNVKTNMDVYYKLTQMAQNDPDAFRSTNLRSPEYADGLGKSEAAYFMQLQMALSGGKPGQDDPIITATNQSMAKAMKDATTRFEGEGFKKGKLNKEQAKIQEFLIPEIQAAVRANGGKELSPQQRANVISGVLSSVNVPGMLYGTNAKPLYELELDDIPEEDVKRIRQRFNDSGYTQFSDAQVILFYFKEKLKNQSPKAMKPGVNTSTLHGG